MPTYDATIGQLVAGDFRQIPWQINNIPANGSVSKGWITIKADPTTADPGLIQKVITTTLDTSKGQITNTGSVAGVATGFFNLLSADTILMTPETPYYYDLQ